MNVYMLEAAVLVAMSVIWYLSIAKVVLARRAAPRRTVVVTILCTAYLVGMASKLGELPSTGRLDPLFWLHFINIVIVFVDFQLTALYARTHHRLREVDPRPREPVIQAG